ncbi:MAG: sugar phosphate isomerase/epimerase [Verrucomicrobia bacterium]|nr:sugar phosphate isomerase/epimerase [Verrucomicrobiota bacterium]
MERCFSSLGCPECTLEEVLALARTEGLPAVELRALGGSLDLPEYFARHYGTPPALAARLDRETVRVAAFDTSLKLVGSTEAEWEAAIAAFLPWAEGLGGVRLRVFDGGTGADGEIAQMAGRLAWWRQRRQVRGWRTEVMVETHDSLFTAAAVRTLIDAVPGIGVLWDSHHTWKRGGEDPLVTWRALRSHVVHIHVKDSVSRPSANLPYTYVRPGEGEFPAGPLMQALALEYAGVISLEWEKLWHPYLGPVAEALQVAGRRHWW